MQYSWRRAQFRVYLISLIFGALAGILILYPASEFVYFEEYRPESTGAMDYTVAQMRRSLRGETPRKTAFYALVGVVLSGAVATLFTAMQRRTEQIQRLSAALEGDLTTLIAQGESANLEFKSSFRWDVREGKLNHALEGVVLKTLAGYMNANGGALLIGVADDGSILGLQHDYQTLKRPDRDGFEQVLMTSVATKLGADACRSVQTVFSRLQDQDVCRVIVMPAHRPVYVHDGGSPRLYVRTGVSTRELNVQEAIDYTTARWPK